MKKNNSKVIRVFDAAAPLGYQTDLFVDYPFTSYKVSTNLLQIISKNGTVNIPLSSIKLFKILE